MDPYSEYGSGYKMLRGGTVATVTWVVPTTVWPYLEVGPAAAPDQQSVPSEGASSAPEDERHTAW